MHRDNCVVDRDPAIFAELAQGARDGFARGAGHRGHLLVGKKKREAEPAAVQVLADLVRKLKQETAKPGGHCLGKCDAACVLQRKAVFLTDALYGAHLRFFMASEEAEKPLPLHRAKLGRSQRFGGDFVNAVREHGIQPEDGARSGDTNDHLPVLHPASGELEVAIADEIEAASIFPLGEERCLGWQADGARHQFQIRKDCAAKGAKPAGTSN